MGTTGGVQYQSLRVIWKRDETLFGVNLPRLLWLWAASATMRRQRGRWAHDRPAVSWQASLHSSLHNITYYLLHDKHTLVLPNYETSEWKVSTWEACSQLAGLLSSPCIVHSMTNILWPYLIHSLDIHSKAIQTMYAGYTMWNNYAYSITQYTMRVLLSRVIICIHVYWPEWSWLSRFCYQTYCRCAALVTEKWCWCLLQLSSSQPDKEQHS